MSKWRSPTCLKRTNAFATDILSTTVKGVVLVRGCKSTYISISSFVTAISSILPHRSAKSTQSSVLRLSCKNHFFFNTRRRCALRTSPCSSVPPVGIPIGGNTPSSTTGKALWVVVFKISTM
ncbi:hypothetical protein Leryth_017856 [Lithospermum erythrorhizon]|nr:hypothetical protein Leryth_017856 [Lithospermum erythrorhizon]